jgi:hypothetical protein
MEKLAKSRAEELDAKAIADYKVLESTWVSFGQTCLEIYNSTAYKQLGYISFDAWVVARGFSKTVAYESKGIVDKLKGKGLKDDVIAKLPKGNAKLLTKLSESQLREPGMIEAAQTLPEPQIEAAVMSRLTGAQIEIMVRRVIKLPETLADRWDYAIQVAKFMETTDSTEVAIERIITDFLAEHMYAYEAITGKLFAPECCDDN